MNVLKLLFIFAAFVSVQSREIESAEKSDVFISELSTLFDIRGDDQNSLDNKENSICDTKECQIIANEFSRGMNKSVAPCDNFYEFMCGAWKDESHIPKYAPMWSRFHIFQDTVNRRIKGILETEPRSTDILPVRQAKKWYRSCLDVGTLEKRGIKPMEAILQQLGGWPMTLDPEEWNAHEHSWQSIEHEYFHITGGHVFYEISKLYSDNFGVMIEKGSIPLYAKLPAKYRNYTGNDYETYVDFVTVVTQMFVDYNKAAVTSEMIENDVRDLVEFEKQLYLLARSIDEYNYDDWTISDFVSWYSANLTELGFGVAAQKIDFENLIQRKFDLVNHEIQNTDYLTVDANYYYIQLTELLNQTSTRTIVNYIHWHFVSGMLIYTTEAMRDAFFVLMKNEFDVEQRPPRWLECIKEMEMNTAAAFAFVEKYFSDQVEEAAREMIDNVHQEMAEQIDRSNWMDDEAKVLAKEKLAAMNIFVGFPDWYKNKTSVLNSYKGLTIGYDHFDNVLSFRKYEIKKSLRYTQERPWDIDIISQIDPTMVNAFYDPWKNTIALPAALFQPPLFTSRVPQSVNYGIIGLAAGHEIGHGFDNSGIRMGHDGNETKLSEEMLELYDERAECFVEQFNGYYGVTEDPNSDDIYSKEMSRGRKTRPDNIADSVGLHSVFKAFKKLTESDTITNYKLPGFDEYTNDQMFFISFAALWCEAITPKFAEKLAMFDSHSPGRFRVIGPVSNTAEFAEAFNCPSGSPMNPINKCDIWQAPLDGGNIKKSRMLKRRRRLGWIRRF